MSVHHIHVKPVSTSSLDRTNLVVEAAKIAGENGWGDEEGVQGHGLEAVIGAFGLGLTLV
jgi:hypothetical protein